MKKTAIIFLMVITGLVGIKAEGTPTFFPEGQQLFVVASSGLNLRATPERDAITHITIPYGELVEVLAIGQECLIIEEIEWTRGSWIKVAYDGFEGYVFDGFLSPLAVPRNYTEASSDNVSIFNLVDDWVDINLLALDSPDTVQTEIKNSIIQYFECGEKYEKQLFDNGFRAELFLTNVRIMDVFHLVKGFYTEIGLKGEVDHNSIFIKDKNGNLKTIKVKLGNECEIKKLKNGQIRLRINKSFDRC